MHSMFAVSVAACVVASLATHAAIACDDAPSECAFQAGMAALHTNPEEAAKQFLASHTLDPKPRTLAAYALAQLTAKHYALAAKAYAQAKADYQPLLAASSHAVDAARTASDPTALASAQQAYEELANKVAAIDLQLGRLATQTAHVRLRYAAGAAPAGIVVVHPGEARSRTHSVRRSWSMPGRTT